MFNIVLYQPEIPPNTGNIIRLCANSGCSLHLIHPLGFNLDEKQVRRAGLDYHEFAGVQEHKNYEEFEKAIEAKRIIACTTKGSMTHSDFAFHQDDILLFVPETRGLPDDMINRLSSNYRIRIPMQPHSRSLNLSNAVAIILYESLLQLNYPSPH